VQSKRKTEGENLHFSFRNSPVSAAPGRTFAHHSGETGKKVHDHNFDAEMVEGVLSIKGCR